MIILDQNNVEKDCLTISDEIFEMLKILPLEKLSEVSNDGLMALMYSDLIDNANTVKDLINSSLQSYDFKCGQETYKLANFRLY